MTSFSDSPAVYFAAGALLPTIALLLLQRKAAVAPFPDNKSDNTAESDNEIDDDDDDDNDSDSENYEVDSPNWGLQHAPYKMVLCVNTSLSMGKGKIAAQCCHAAVGCYKRAIKACPGGVKAWEYTGCAKICVKIPMEEEMETIAAIAMSKGIPTYLVEDAGRTQIAAGSRTVLGLGPAPVHVFEGVTDHLKLM